MDSFVIGKRYAWEPPPTLHGFSIWHEDLAALLEHKGAGGNAKMGLVMPKEVLVCLEQHTEHDHAETGLLYYVKFLTKYGDIGWCMIQPSYIRDWKLVTE